MFYKGSFIVLPIVLCTRAGASIGTKKFHGPCSIILLRNIAVMSLTRISSDVGREPFSADCYNLVLDTGYKNLYHSFLLKRLRGSSFFRGHGDETALQVSRSPHLHVLICFASEPPASLWKSSCEDTVIHILMVTTKGVSAFFPETRYQCDNECI